MPSAASAARTAALSARYAAEAAAGPRRPPAGPAANLTNLSWVRGRLPARARTDGGSASQREATAFHRSRRVGRSKAASTAADGPPAAATASACAATSAAVGPKAGTLRRPEGFSTTTTARDMASTRSRVASAKRLAASDVAP